MTGKVDEAESQKPALAAKAASVVGWVLGSSISLSAVVSLLTERTPYGWVSGMGLLIIGATMLPPVVTWLRSTVPALRWPALPTFTGLVLGIVIINLNPYPAPPPSPAPASETKINRPKPPSDADRARSAAADEPAPSPSVQKAAVGPKVEIVAAGDVLRPAQDALNEGDIDRAIELFFGRSVSAERRARPDGKKLLAAIQKASDDQIGRSPAGDFIERVHDHWLPQIEAIPTTGPVTDEEIRNHRVFLEEVAARELKASRPLPASPELKKAQDQLAAALRTKQASAFPHWRRVYSERLDRVLWEKNIDVAAVGSGGRTIRFIGGIFASNANIGTFQRGIEQDLKLLRFNRATYQWMPDAPGSAYRLTVPADSDLGFWSGRQFENVP